MSRAKAESQHLHALLMEQFPAAFPSNYNAIRPLKIGITEELLLRLGDTVNRKLLNSVLANQTGRDGYLLAVLRGEARIDLDGHPARTISETAKARAAQRLAAPVQRQQTRAAARKAQAEKEQRRTEEHRRIEEKRQLKAERQCLHEEAIRRKVKRLAAETAQPTARSLAKPLPHHHWLEPARSTRPVPPVPTPPAQAPTPPGPASVTVKTGTGTAKVTVTVKKRRTLSLKQGNRAMSAEVQR